MNKTLFDLFAQAMPRPQAPQNQPNEHQKMLQQAYMANTPESRVKNKVKKALDDLGAYYCFPVTGGFGNSGVPDILACVEGHFFGIECKAGNNAPTALQEKHLSNINESKGSAFVVDETNADNVKHIIIAKLGEFHARKNQ